MSSFYYFIYGKQAPKLNEVDVIRRRTVSLAVYKVVEAAHRNLVKFGEDVQLPPRNRFELIKDANKVFFRIKKSLPRDHTFEEYKEKLKNMRLDLYDTYEGDKGEEFEAWLENVWETAKRR